MRVAVMDLSSEVWTAGGTFTEVVVRALRLAGDKDIGISVMNPKDAERWIGIAQPVSLERRDYLLRRVTTLRTAVEIYCDEHHIGALLLPMHLLPTRPHCKRITWVPDFQHEYLRQYYSSVEVRQRRRWYNSLARHADLVLLSSDTVLGDYTRLLPRYAAKGRMLHFPSLYAFLPPLGLAGRARERYGLPEKYLLVANQFWAHKNHMVVIRAVAQLRRQGLRVPVVLTGLPADSRDPANTTLSMLLQAIATEGLSGQVIPLGLVPKIELTDLIRCTCAVIQPSRFEGWSTVVQDTLALGRPVICSDIAVHREQAPEALGFFGCDDPEGLAGIIERVWGTLQPGPDIVAEQCHLAQSQTAARTYGEDLLQLCRS